MTPASLWQPGATGVYAGLDFDTYKRAPGINQSKLKLLERSALHYRHDTESGDEPNSPSLLIGTLVHSMILEPSKPLPYFTVKPVGMDGRSTDGRAWFAAQKEAGLEVLTDDQWQSCIGMARALAGHSKIRTLVQSGTSEVSMFWHTPCAASALLCKARLDSVPSTNCLLDIKTTRNDARAFHRDMREHKYHVQFAWYLDGWNSTHPDDQRNAFAVAVAESKPPHGVLLYILSPEALEAGRAEYQSLLQTYIETIGEGKFPGYTEDILPLSLNNHGT